MLSPPHRAFAVWISCALGSSLVCTVGCSPGLAGVVQEPASGGECAVELGPSVRAAPLARPVAARVQAASQIVVHVEQELAALTRLIEARVPARVGEGRFRIGPGGTVSYQAERGAVAVSVAQGALVIDTPVRARAEACRGDSCYASCEPEALVRAEVPLLLRPDYRFEPARVSLRFTRGCKVRALGGLLTIDVTPSLQSQIEPQLARVGREIGGQLPDLRAEAEKAWAQAFEARPLPLLGCFILAPEGVTQGPVASSTRSLRARFALQARPELRPSCPAASSIEPLPPLQRDPALGEEGIVRLGMVSELEALSRALEGAGPSTASGKRVSVKGAEVAAHGADVQLDVSLRGEACGEVSFQASPDFSADGQWIGLTRARVTEAERRRIEAAGLDASALIRGLSAAPRLSPLLSVSGFAAAVPVLAAALSQRSIQVSAAVSSTRAGGATARGNELVAWLEARGSLTLKQQ